MLEMPERTISNKKAEQSLVVQTRTERWVMPRDFLLMRVLVQRKNLSAKKLIFKSEQARHDFIHDLFLLSFEDEQYSKSSSPLALLGRKLLEQGMPNHSTPSIQTNPLVQ